jgi:hypothetical protein
MSETTYDEAVDAWRTATRKVLGLGDDKPDLTAEDLRDMLETMIEEEGE